MTYSPWAGTYGTGVGCYGEGGLMGEGGGGYHYGCMMKGDGNGMPLSSRIGALQLVEVFLVIQRMRREEDIDVR